MIPSTVTTSAVTPDTAPNTAMALAVAGEIAPNIGAAASAVPIMAPKARTIIKRQCFACGQSSIIGTEDPCHRECDKNQKYTLRCCGRCVCVWCLAAFGRRFQRQSRTDTNDGRVALRDKFCDELNRWLVFCESGHYTRFERLKKHREDVVKQTSQINRSRDTEQPAHPPKCRTIQDLRPEYRNLKCPFCVRKKGGKQCQINHEALSLRPSSKMGAVQMV